MPEGTTYQDNSSEMFGQGLFSKLMQHGLVGLNPLFIHDPRFDYSVGMRGTQPTLTNPASGDSIGFKNFNTNPRFLPDLDEKTVADDMWAVTKGGHTGTSVGDRSSGPFMRLSQMLNANNGQITPEMVQRMNEIMLQIRSPELRQYHPGLPAYAPTQSGTK